MINFGLAIALSAKIRSLAQHFGEAEIVRTLSNPLSLCSLDQIRASAETWITEQLV